MSSAMVRWSWCASPGDGARTMWGEHDLATSVRASLTSPQIAGNRFSGRSSRSMVRSAWGRNSRAAVLASCWRSAVPVSTTYRARRSRSASPSRKPPAPISMSSGCAPMASTDSGSPAGASRCNGSMALRGGDEGSRAGQLGRARALRIPHHPRALPAVVHLLELGALLDRIGGRPVALVRVGEHPALVDQPRQRVFHQVFALVEVVEDLRAEHEVAAVLPLAQVPHRGDLGDQAVLGHVDDM